MTESLRKEGEWQYIEVREALYVGEGGTKGSNKDTRRKAMKAGGSSISPLCHSLVSIRVD